MVAFAEVAGLDQAFFYQGLQAVIHLAQAHAHLPGQLALADIRVGFQLFEYVVAGVFAWHGALHVLVISDCSTDEHAKACYTYLQ